MWISVDIALVRLVQTLKVLFNEQVQARRRGNLDADLLTFSPFGDHVCGSRHTNYIAVEVGSNSPGAERDFQKINQAALWRKLNT